MSIIALTAHISEQTHICPNEVSEGGFQLTSAVLFIFIRAMSASDLLTAKIFKLR